jgi:hypothetical protein
MPKKHDDPIDPQHSPVLGPSNDLDEHGDPSYLPGVFARDLAGNNATCSPPGYVCKATVKLHQKGQPHDPRWCRLCQDEAKAGEPGDR